MTNSFYKLPQEAIGGGANIVASTLIFCPYSSYAVLNNISSWTPPICFRLQERYLPVKTKNNKVNIRKSIFILYMTLALGARCNDGVAIVEDKRIYKEFSMTRERITYSEKLSGVIRNMIFAYSGDVDMYDIFVKYVVGEVVILRDDSTQYTNQNMIEKLCHIMDKLRENCKPRSLNILVGRQFPQNGSSDLHVIKLTGEQNVIDSWTSIGSGSVYSNKLICNYWDNNMNMKEFAELSYCIIEFIEKNQLDQSVGIGDGKPSIRYLKDAEDLDLKPSNYEYYEFENAYVNYLSRFKEILDIYSTS